MNSKLLSRRYQFLGILAGLLSFTLLAVPHAQAFEEANVSPNPNNNTSPIGYFVAKENYINSNRTSLVIYSRSQEIAVYVSGADVCDNAPIQSLTDKNDILQPVGRLMTSYMLRDPYVPIGSTPAAGQADGYVASNGNCNAASVSPDNFPPGGSFAFGSVALAPTTRVLRATASQKLAGRDDIWVFKFTATAQTATCFNNINCFFNAYRVMARNMSGNTVTDGSGIWISQDQQTSVTAEQFGFAPGANPDYFNYNLHFATSCDITSATPASIRFYDDDNYDGSPAQDPGGVFQPFRFVLQRAPRNTVAWATVPISSVQWIAPDGVSAVPNGQRRYYPPVGGYEGYGTTTGKNTIILNFTADPLYVYRVTFINVYKRNNIQFRLPYETVYADNQCQGRVFPAAQINPTDVVEVGQTANIHFEAHRPVTNVFAGQVAYHRVVWLDRDGDQIYNPAVDGGASWDDQGIVIIPAGGPGLGADLATFTSAAARPGDKYVCGYLRLFTDYAGSPKDLSVDPPPTRTVCTIVAKKPNFKVEGGDIRSGGVFNNGSGCSMSSAYVYGRIEGSDYTGYGNPSGYGNVAQYGVFATGNTTEVGSSNTEFNSAALGGVERSLLFGTGSWSGSGPPRAASDYGGGGIYDGFFNIINGVVTPGMLPANWHTGTRCLPDGFRLYGQTSAASNINGLSGINAGSTHQTFFTNGQQETICETEGANCLAAAPGTYTLQSGQRIVMQYDNPGTTGGIVYIATNVVSTNAPMALNSLPQFVLIVDAGVTVVFRDDVTRFDGLIITKSAVNTCSVGWNVLPTAASPSMTDGQCTSQLRVNGAIITSKIVQPRRTHGQGEISDPAEIFKLTPEAVVADYFNAVDRGGVTTVTQSEIAPRF